MTSDLRGKKVLVTGATGFIGGRLVERLVLEHGAQVRALVRDFMRAPRIARFAIEMVRGDVVNLDDVQKAAQGCEVIFHCAYGNRGDAAAQRLVNVQGTEDVLRAALDAQATRVVHVSTVSVYGSTPDGDLEETAPRRDTGDVYGNTKLEAEQLVLQYGRKHGLPVSIIQPTVVYGPWGPVWTIEPLRRLKTGRMILVDDGRGFSNAVYVDDVVTAMLLAAVRPEAVGEAFLISGGEPVPWLDFFGAYERMLGVQATVSVPLTKVSKIARSQGTLKQIIGLIREKPQARRWLLSLPAIASSYRLMRKVVPKAMWQMLHSRLLEDSNSMSLQVANDRPIHPMDVGTARFYTTRTLVRIDKARKLLGYEPAFDLARGMALTEQWARWANLLN